MDLILEIQETFQWCQYLFLGISDVQFALNLLCFLQGEDQVPGLAVMRTGGVDPLQEMQVQLRGISTLYGSTDLLYVIDGVPQASFNMVMPADTLRRLTKG